MVDADTGRPLTGVVVLALWFQIPWRLTRYPFLQLDGPNFMFLTPGYGIWKVPHPPVYDVDDAVLQSAMAKQGWRRLEERGGGIVQLEPIRTAEDRCRAERLRRFNVDIPAELVPRWWEAYEAEQRLPGLPPLQTCR